MMGSGPMEMIASYALISVEMAGADAAQELHPLVEREDDRKSVKEGKERSFLFVRTPFGALLRGNRFGEL
jgi:hypothetical protein